MDKHSVGIGRRERWCGGQHALAAAANDRERLAARLAAVGQRIGFARGALGDGGGEARGGQRGGELARCLQRHQERRAERARQHAEHDGVAALRPERVVRDEGIATSGARCECGVGEDVGHHVLDGRLQVHLLALRLKGCNGPGAERDRGAVGAERAHVFALAGGDQVQQQRQRGQRGRVSNELAQGGRALLRDGLLGNLAEVRKHVEDLLREAVEVLAKRRGEALSCATRLGDHGHARVANLHGQRVAEVVGTRIGKALGHGSEGVVVSGGVRVEVHQSVGEGRYLL